MNKFVYTLITSLFCFFVCMFFVGELVEKKNK